MKSRSLVIYLFLIALVGANIMTGTYAFAQSKAFVRVPFAFTANHQNFPAGYYKLELLSDRVLSFTDNDTGKHHAILMVRPDPVPYIETRGVMRFLRTENRHYLTEIRFAGSSTHSAPILRGSLERELAHLQNVRTPVEIAMR